MSKSLYERAENYYGYHMRNIRHIEEEFEERRQLRRQPAWVRLLVVLALTIFMLICVGGCALLAWKFFII